MYLVDCYEHLLPAMGLFDHATFVSFFPYVISGPIPRAKRILHQLPGNCGKVGDAGEMLARGIYLFTIGLFKKVVLGDFLAPLVNAGFSSNAHLSATEAWVFSICFTLQIYFDFSGYSDMAIASALMLGIEIPRNFDAPLRSKSIIEFWQRWHISLSEFIFAYLYTPILRSLGRARLLTSAVATLAAMTIAGLWHGPAWTFIVYGVLQGVGLSINQIWRKKKMPKLPSFLSWMLTFILVDISLLYFRSATVSSGFHAMLSMFSPEHFYGIANLLDAAKDISHVKLLLIFPIAIVAAFLGKSSDELSREFRSTLPNMARAVAMSWMSWLAIISRTAGQQQFLYFKF
jgi:D-alanyl-lipoteichoic acid acyltransferase DltB (MBOAT superfamily)